MSACFDTVTSFKDCADGFQSIVVALAVLGGGAWTLFVFWSLGTKTKADLELFQQGVINIEIEAQQIEVPGGTGLYLAAIATLTNVGNRNVALFFDDRIRPFLLSSIEFTSEGHGTPQPIPVILPESFGSTVAEVEDPAVADADEISGFELSNSYTDSAILRRNAIQRVPFFARVPRPGLYLVEFRTRLNEVEHQVDLQDVPGRDDERYWTSSTYVTVAGTEKPAVGAIGPA